MHLYFKDNPKYMAISLYALILNDSCAVWARNAMALTTQIAYWRCVPARTQRAMIAKRFTTSLAERHIRAWFTPAHPGVTLIAQSNLNLEIMPVVCHLP